MSGYVYLSNGEPLANEHGVIYLARAERTCSVERTYHDELWEATCTLLSCGHEAWECTPKYCPECGAKVVKQP